MATLIARGGTNREIAAALVIAESTAVRHVANILDKLGLKSRAQVAAWTVEHGLRGVADGSAGRLTRVAQDVGPPEAIYTGRILIPEDGGLAAGPYRGRAVDRSRARRGPKALPTRRAARTLDARRTHHFAIG